MKIISKLLFGSFRKYKAIHGKTVAAAMINAAKKEEAGTYRYTYDEIMELAGQTTSTSHTTPTAL